MENRKIDSLKSLERLCDQLFLIDGNLNQKDKKIIEKELKALQIIKNHIGVIKGYIYTTDSQITDSEYKLLCEVLLWDS